MRKTREILRLKQICFTRAVSLSTAGTALYERAAHHLRGLDEAIGKLPERGAEPSGLLRMTVPHDFAPLVMPDVLSQFGLRYPDVSFDVHVTNDPVDLVAEGFDLAIRATSSGLKDSTLTVRRLGNSSIGFYAAPSYIARRGKPKTLLADDHVWAIHPRLLEAWKRPRERVRYVCDNFEVLRDLGRDGAGIAAIPDYLASPYVRAGALEAISIVGRS